MELIAHCSLKGEQKQNDQRIHSESHCSLKGGQKQNNQRIHGESHCSLESWCYGFQIVPQQSHCPIVSILNSQAGSTVKSWWQFRPMTRFVKRDAHNTKVCCPTEYLIKNCVNKGQERGGLQERGGHVPLTLKLSINQEVDHNKCGYRCHEGSKTQFCSRAGEHRAVDCPRRK